MNINKISQKFVMILLLTAWLIGCSIPGGSPTRLPEMTIPPSELPSPTPIPTALPLKTETEETLERWLDGGKIMLIDSFDDLSPDMWDSTAGLVKASDGEVVVQGKSNWATDLKRSTSGIEAGEGVVIRFRFNQSIIFSVGLLHGEWEKPECRLFGFTHPAVSLYRVDAWEGKNNLAQHTSPTGDLVFQNDVWYEIMITVDQGGELMFTIWNPADPSKQKMYRKTYGEKWSGLDWRLWVNGDSGLVYLDDYMEIFFNKIK